MFTNAFNGPQASAYESYALSITLRVYHSLSVWGICLRQPSKLLCCKLFKLCVLPTRVRGRGTILGATRILLGHLM